MRCISYFLSWIVCFALLGFVGVACADTYFVRNIVELNSAIDQANRNSSSDTIKLYPGHYLIAKRLVINRDNVQIQSTTSNPNDVILSGLGMKYSKSVEVLFDIQANNITLSGLTFQNSSNHLIQVRAELGVLHFTLTNSVLRDSFEQMVKVSGGKGDDTPFSDFGRIENCVFEYTQGIGPQFYIGGIDAHRIRNWTIKNNIFRNIASPSAHVAEHAIHIWNHSRDNIVAGNVIINSDRGIGFGLGRAPNQNVGGIIENNIIIHTRPDHPFADAGIILESSPGTIVRNNIVQLNTSYPNAIEYRFPETTDVQIYGNTVNKAIRARDGGKADVFSNKTND